MRKIITIFFSSLLIIGIIVGAAYFYSEHKENEKAAFHYAAVEELKSYDENEPLFHGGTNYNSGQGRYIVIVKNQRGKEYTYEVLLNDDRSLFEIHDLSLSKQEMIVVWEKVWTLLFDALRSLESQDLLTSITIRGEKHTVLEAIERQLAHYAYHSGQLVYSAKQRTNENWDTLTIPKGKSAAYLQAELNKQQS